MLNNFFVSSFSHVNLSKAVCYTCIWVAHSVKLQPLNTAESGFESRVNQLYKFDLCFCSSHRIFCLCSSLIRTICSFVLVWTSVHFWTSEPICFFHVYSVSAVLLFPLCTALPALPGLGPGNRCLQLYLLYFLSHWVYGSPMKGTW